MFDRIDDFNSNLANQVTLWVALHTTMPQTINRSNTNFNGQVKRNAFFAQRAEVLVNGTATYPSAGEA
jgi:hypothetical protein